MGTAVVLAVVASFCTASASVCQRLGARSVPVGKFGPGLLIRLATKPIWLLGITAMIAGFGFQFAALHFGDLALVQPILGSELLFVFAYMAIIGSARPRRRDWFAAGAMAVGLGVFLLVASPHGGRLHAPATSWWLAGVSALGLAAIVTVAAYVRIGGRRPSPARRAATLGVATGVSWGFVAAIIKELTAHTNGGTSAVLGTWSTYALVVIGAASVLVSSHALQAGPLAASQPGFTIVDPLIASLLGVFIFGEHIRLQAGALAIEIASLAVLAGGVIALSGSQLVQGDRAGTTGDVVIDAHGVASTEEHRRTRTY
jgi:drug/metabolite transporter (DMT)-like permease